MTGKTHLLGGAAAAAVYLTAAASGDFGAPDLNTIQGAVSIPLCLLGSLVPDIDLRTSTIGEKAPLVAFLVNALLGHRTFFHSPLFLAILYVWVNAHFPGIIWIVIPIIVGAASPLVLDMLNRSGVPLLWPLQTRFWIVGIKTDGQSERILRMILAALTILVFTRFVFS